MHIFYNKWIFETATLLLQVLVAEVLDINEKGKLEVFYPSMESEANGKIFKYDASNEWEEISKEVTKHVEKPKINLITLKYL